jgi:hypothetical protein
MPVQAPGMPCMTLRELGHKCTQRAGSDSALTPLPGCFKSSLASSCRIGVASSSAAGFVHAVLGNAGKLALLGGLSEATEAPK